METLTANVGAARKVTQHGRNYLVAPVTLIVSGVLDGSQGPLLYPPDEVARSTYAWNGMPIVIYHPPVINGRGNSARDPDILNRQGVGYLYHATSNEGNLAAEAWFDEEPLTRVDDRVLRALNLGEKIEVSTGLGLERELAPPGSVHTDGRPYTHVARNLRPDHLAVLPDQVGACSIKDGCGIMNKESRDSLLKKVGSLLGLNLLGATLGTTNQSGARWIGTTGVTREHSHSVDLNVTGDGWTNDERDHNHRVKAFKVYAQWQEPEGTDRHKHSLDRKSLIDSGVRRNVATPINKDKESDMDPKAKKTLIDNLIANCDCWTEEDREFLENRNDKSLEVFQLAVNASKQIEAVDALNTAATKGFTDPGGNEHIWNTETKVWDTKTKVEPPPLPVTVTNANPVKPKTTEEWMATAPEEVQRAVTNAMELEQAERERLTAAIIENADGDETKARLRKHADGLQMDMLRDFAALSPKPVEPVRNYGGAAVPAGVDNRNEDTFKADILPMPSMVDLIPKGPKD